MTTLGVEEEFLLVDATTRHTTPRAGGVLARVPKRDLPDGAVLHRELLDTQVEFSTGVCASPDEARAQLLAGRQALAAAASQEGALLVATGNPVLTGPTPPPADAERFAAIDELYRAQVSDYHCCGLHVHVGVPDRDTAVAVVNHLRPWLPTLLAVSVNSPFDHGRDTGYGSWRMMHQARFPGSGVTPFCTSATDYDLRVARQVEAGVVVDESMSFWLARPSPRHPTVEVRAADTALTVEDAVVQASLTWALAKWALAELDAGREAPDVDAAVLTAAVWSAARYGLDGPGVDPWTGRRTPAGTLLRSLWELVADHTTTGPVFPVVTGARRQRDAAAVGGPEAVVDLAARACVESAEPGIPRS